MRYRGVPGPVRGRLVLAFAGLISLTVGLILLPAASRSVASVTSSGTHSALSSATTVTGPRLYNPVTGKPLPHPSTVTVSQTANLTSQVVHVSWASFTPSVPNNAPGPWYQYNATFYGVMVVECHGANPKSYKDCSGANNGGVPAPKDENGILNTAYAISTPKGTGQVPFDVQTGLQNRLLGCDQTHQCSLVVVPGQGGDRGNCTDHSGDVEASQTSGNAMAGVTYTFGPGGTGPCSWPDRIVIPLRFAPVPTGCPPRNPVFSSVGSPMLFNAMQQWLTGLCAGRNGLSVSYISQLGEQIAVGDAVSGGADVAFTTLPASAQKVPTGSQRFYYAPVAVSAAAIAYWLDDNNTGQPLSGLRLDQRLLTKLLTTSYNPDFADDKGVAGNPFYIFADPEFASLDKSIVQHVNPLNIQAYTIPALMQGSSDITWTVTRWIAANPAASAFLKGEKAPGGMHINTYYKGTKYPTSTFITQDPSTEYSKLFNTVAGLANVVNYQAINAFPGDYWQKDNTGNYPAMPPEPVGNRALISLMDQGDAALNQFPVVAIPNAAGKYVRPDNASMAAALSHMISDGDGTLQMNLANTDPKAYPLTMVIYAMVPAKGLTHAKATAIARFLNFTAGPGQTPGLGPGKLPPGYLPLTAALRAKTKDIATKVAEETAAGDAPGGGSGPPGGESPTPGPSLPASPSPTPSVSLPGTGPGASGQPVTLLAAHSQTSPITRFALPALLILGGVAALAGSSAVALAAEGGARAQFRRMARGTVAGSRRAWRASASAGRTAVSRARTLGRPPRRRKP